MTVHLVIYEMENGKRRDLHTTVMRPEPGSNDASKIYAAMLKAEHEVDEEEHPMWPKRD